MVSSSLASSLRFSPAASNFWRAYRLVDEQGEPHPVLDDLYDSHEAAWAEALNWWHQQPHPSQQPIGIGIEVSTSNGGWRTIRHPGHS